VLKCQLKMERSDSPIPHTTFQKAETIIIHSIMAALGAGHAPTEAVCWSLLTTFEAAGEATRADKVIAYMEAQGMS